MASTKSVDVVVRKGEVYELKAALEILDNPNSANPNPQEAGKPTKWKFKNPSQTRYSLAMSYRTIADAFRIIEKVRVDMVRNKMDEQLKAQPDTDTLVGKWNQETVREVEKMRDEEVTLALMQVSVADLDLDNNAIPFTVIGVLLGKVIVDCEVAAKDED